MGDDVDEYIRDVVAKGDESSNLLAAKVAPTLRNSDLVEILNPGMNGISVLRTPEVHFGVVHSAGGNPDERNLKKYSKSLVDRLVKQAKAIGATPIAFADVVDANIGDRETVELIADSLVSRANHYSLAIMNGELAILGNRVNCDANLSGTMISLIGPEKAGRCIGISRGTGIFSIDGVKYVLFDPAGKAVYINSDGIGTKTEFYERAKKYPASLGDSLAMKVDDTIKIGAEVVVVSDVVETKGKIPFSAIEKHAARLGKKFGFKYILQQEEIGSRIMGYNDKAPSFNVSGSAVSVIDEKMLRNPPKPSAGEYLVAIAGAPNPRSNGITDKRKMMIKLFGNDYQKTREGQIFLEYLTQPSTVLYPVFKKLIDEGLATSVYHMSGGAYNGKLARPLAKHNLFVFIDHLFPPDWREITLAGANFTSAETSYSKWPMGNDGFVTTMAPAEAIRLIESLGLDAKIVGILGKAVNGRTGVKLKAFNGQEVYYSGKD